MYTTKIKIMSSSNKEHLEKQVNDFMEYKKVIDVQYSVIQDFNDYNCWCHSVMIRYKEEKHTNGFELYP